MSVAEAVAHQPAGATFFRADLHIHSYGGSHDVADQTMTPEAILATAAAENIAVVAITDHNDISNIERALAAAKSTDVLVIPGVELSTSQGHLLCYFATAPELGRFFAQLNIADPGTNVSRCQESILECLNLVEKFNGFGILAHVDAPAGFEHEVPGASPHKVDVICHRGLLGIELKNAASDISFCPKDPNADRTRMGKDRITRLGLGSKQFLAKVLNSDAHALNALGRNAASAKRVTRYKMDVPNFAALKLALEDADARVRIEDQIPSSVPRVHGMMLDGGFLNGHVIRFSPNLNCIIGGRGTGKSTTFEGIRCLIDSSDPSSSVVDSEVWPDKLHLFWQDKAGVLHSLIRQKDRDLENLDDGDLGPCSFDIDCFGQGDAVKISQQAQTNPLVLLAYLDRFIDLKAPMEAEEGARDELLELQTQIEEAVKKVELIPQFTRQWSTTKQQLDAMRKPEVKELIELQRQLTQERTLRTEIMSRVKQLKEGDDDSIYTSLPNEIAGLADPSELKLGSTEFHAIVAGAEALKSTVDTAHRQIVASVGALEQIVTTQITTWKTKEQGAQDKIDAKKKELEALKVPFDMAFIAKLTQDEASAAQSVRNLNTWKPHLLELRRRRAEALARRWTARDRIATIRETFGRQASATLKEALTDLEVSLKFSRNAFSPEGAEQIIAVMGWRTNQQVRANYLVEDLTIPELLTAITKKDVTALTRLTTKDGNAAIFEREEAQLIIDRLAEPANKAALERVALFDLPRLRVSRTVDDGAGGKFRAVREFTKLSLGQQQSILLALMLSANSDKPLIIDQPEDNLDGEFIYATLVPVLRMAKERRQVIIVTHNPNVAVLGDAELIIVMKAFNDRGTIVARGSIDNPETRDAACAILEGAKEAFTRRAKMYGIGLK